MKENSWEWNDMVLVAVPSLMGTNIREVIIVINTTEKELLYLQTKVYILANGTAEGDTAMEKLCMPREMCTKVI